MAATIIIMAALSIGTIIGKNIISGEDTGYGENYVNINN